MKEKNECIDGPSKIMKLYLSFQENYRERKTLILISVILSNAIDS